MNERRGIFVKIKPESRRLLENGYMQIISIQNGGFHYFELHAKLNEAR